MGYKDEVPFNILVGKTLVDINGSEQSLELLFTTTDGDDYKMYHSQDCCEHVRIEEIIGDLNDLIGVPILLAEEIISKEPDEETKIKKEEMIKKLGYDSTDSSQTWTFYKLSTIKGSVTIRWLGESNGYYSESVSFEKVQ